MQRVLSLFDPDSFVELGRSVSDVVTGVGKIEGRDVAAHAATGVIGEREAARIAYLQDLALRSRIPIVVLPGDVDDGSPADWAGRAAVLQRAARASGVIPQVTVGAGLALALSDFAVPDAAAAREMLSYLPSHCGERPPLRASEEPPPGAGAELQALLPSDPESPYDMRDVVRRLLDGGRFFETGAGGLLTGLGRLDGHTVGIVSSQPDVDGGAIGDEPALRAARFVRFCAAFGIPILTLVDSPPLEAGPLGGGAQLAAAYACASSLRLAVALRRARGETYVVMSPRQIGADLYLAWPTADVGGPGPFEAAERGFADAVVEPRETRPALARALELSLSRPL